jgi:D-alanine-D-alanine ligase
VGWNRSTGPEFAVARPRPGRAPSGLGIALVYGPVSAEDRLYHSKCPVEQRSVTALAEALEEIGARWRVLNPCEPDFIMELVEYDVALSNPHGPYGEDGRLQGLLDYLRVPYCGSESGHPRSPPTRSSASA